ncbi:MAG TPA: geranylgeranyl reductase family protein [Candidatus Thermoplasmatota archaeon]
MYDVAVVGAGPGGSTCAYHLARKGLDVALVDKAEFPRQKACGGGLPARVFKSKDLPDFRAAVEAHSDALVLESCPTGDRAYIKGGEPLVYQVRRFVLDKAIFERAVEAGAHPMTRTNVRSYEYADGGVALKVAGGPDIRAKVVVGAGGARDLVAKVLRAREGLPPDWNKYQAHAATRIEPEVGEDVIEEFYGKERAIWVHFNPKGVRGYGWIFPKKTTVNIGVAEFVVTEEDLDLHQVTRDYIRLLEKERLVPPGLDQVKISGAYLPIGGPLAKTYTDRCLLVGDSAGFPSALTGEGMWFALESGRLAAEALGEVLARGEPTREALALYEQKWQAAFGHELSTHLKWTKVFYRIPTRIVRMAARDRWLVKRSSDVLTGNLERGSGRRWMRARVAANAFRYSFRRTPRDQALPGHPGPAIALT